MKKAIPFICVALLTGCATTDIRNDETASKEVKDAAEQIAKWVPKMCSYTTTRRSDGEKMGEGKIATEVVVKRMYVSDKGWYKAETLAQGFIDHIYYDANSITKYGMVKLVCGDKSWNTYPDARSVEFWEHNNKPKTLGINR